MNQVSNEGEHSLSHERVTKPPTEITVQTLDDHETTMLLGSYGKDTEMEDDKHKSKHQTGHRSGQIVLESSNKRLS